MMLKGGEWPSEMGDAGGVERKACRGFPQCIIELSGRSVNSMTSPLSLYFAGE